MNPDTFDWDPYRALHPVTWTDFLQLREYRSRAANARKRLMHLEMVGANPIDIVHERLELQACEWHIRQLEAKFGLNTRYF